MQWIAPQKFSWTSRSHSSRFFSMKSASTVPPALFTSTSMPPWRDSTSRTSAWTLSQSVTSVRTTVAEAAPCWRASPATFSPCAASISAMVTCARSRANACTIARPMFEPPPVTTTLRPARCSSIARLLPELREVHGSLLDERVTALLRLPGLVVEREGGRRELPDAGALLGVDVERLLREPQRRRALLQQLAAPRL